MRFESSTNHTFPERPLAAYAGAKSTAPRTPRVLLLTSGLGFGHLRAAQAIEAALDDNAIVHTLDLWSLINPSVARTIHETYLSLVQNHPDLYERLYHLDEHTWRQILQSDAGPPPQVLEVLELISGIAHGAVNDMPLGARYASDRLLLSLLCTALPYDADSLGGNGGRARLALMKWTWLRLIRRLEPAIRRLMPDVIVSTQMIPAAMTSYLKQRRHIGAPLVGVMTDFGVHDFWKQQGVDRYCTAHPEVEAQVSAIYPHADEVATGVPLMPDFSYPMSQAQARRELVLPESAGIVLVLGGGLGLSVDATAAALLSTLRADARTQMRADAPMQVLVMSGNNAGAWASLQALALQYPHHLRVCEWTERMDRYLSAADIVVSKPGGISVAEALACGRPLFATRSLGGQEGFNVNFLERHQVGGLMSERDLFAHIGLLLQNREQLNHLQRRAWLLGRRDGASRVAQMTMELACSEPRLLQRSR